VIDLREIKQKSERLGLDISTIERDYALSWVLFGIYSNSLLAKALVLKGGTALKKLYFENYRFSQDLDFTVKFKDISGQELKDNLVSAARKAEEASGIEFEFISLEKVRDIPQEEAYEGKIAFVGPRRQKRRPARIKLDITFYEEVMLSPYNLALIHSYSDREDCQIVIPVYRLEEIVAEKLRALLRRIRARDLYDIWYLLKFAQERIDLSEIRSLFEKKRAYKEVKFGSIQDFFIEERLLSYKSSWEASLRRQLVKLPEFEKIIEELESYLGEIFD